MGLFVVALMVTGVVSVVWTHFWGAPWVPSSMRTVRTMLTLAEVKPGEVVYDLGCGDGRIIATAAREFGARAVGVEIDPLRYLFCRARIALFGLRGRVAVRFGDFFHQDLSGAEIVTCYLLDTTNQDLIAKLLAELRPGSRVVSNTFGFKGMEPASQHGQARMYVIPGAIESNEA